MVLVKEHGCNIGGELTNEFRPTFDYHIHRAVYITVQKTNNRTDLSSNEITFELRYMH